ncbi:EpsG family protein [Vibrio furnissii]|uniref:EpsG family protein n=1 Tax=Vibrio furnissii TaxID=29494 RepID=UPI000200D192|nr:EpsG family protein [Vibrio furnissii]ADT85360.1 hypothetical protein vfu_A00123 [Vibrio furnissii NCTC 11218]
MTLELITYVILLIFAVLFIFIRCPSRIQFILYFVLTLFYSIVVRYSGFDLDINTYVRTLSFDNLFSTYYLREPIYWLSSNFIYRNIINKEELVLVLYDVISFLVIYKAYKNLEIPYYFIYLYIIFFPSLMGLQNVYRQYLSMCFLFLSISYAHNGSKKSFFWWLISGLTHNVGFIFLPVLYAFKTTTYSKALFIFSSLSIIVLLPFLSGTKSYDATGLSLGGAYVACTFVILILTIAIHSLCKIKYKTSRYLAYEIYLFILVLFNIFILGPSQAERIGMITLSLSLWILVKLINENVRQDKIISFFMVFLCILPTILFSSAFKMLLTIKG